MSLFLKMMVTLIFLKSLLLTAKRFRVGIDADLSANETIGNRLSHVVEHRRLEGGSNSTFQKGRGHKIFLYGDSTTLYAAEAGGPNGPGFGKLIQDHWQGKAVVDCLGLSGYSTPWGQQALEKLVTKSSDLTDYAFAVLFWGTNDEETTPNSRHASTPQQYEGALMKMGLRLVELSRYKLPLVIMGPPRPGEYKYGGYSPEVAAPYQEAARRVARRLSAVSKSVVYADLNQRIETPADFKDGIHFNAAGNLHVYQTIANVVETNFPQLRPNAMPFRGQAPPLQCPHLAEKMFPAGTPSELDALRNGRSTGGSRFPKWSEKVPGSGDEFAVESERIWAKIPTGIPADLGTLGMRPL